MGDAFFVAAAFLGAAAFFCGVALEVALGASVLVTRPDFVLPRTRDTSASTAGAADAAAVLRGLPALALGAAVFLGAASFLEVDSFLAAASFLGAAFFGTASAFLVVVVAFLGAGAFLVVAFAFCKTS